MEERILKLISGLPDREAARRFLKQLAEKHPGDHAKLAKNEALLSDAATLASFSPLLATTLLQNPEYLWWLNRERLGSGVRSKDELMESLARFSSINSQLESKVLFARFRRRELLRIYLRDIRRLATIAEITEEISNLADATLESALKFARSEMESRFGSPLETDKKGREMPARFCITALGKLGSRELNYSSDIDLLFLYSNEGATSGSGSRDSVTNREYYVKLAEYTIKLIGEPSGEGAAYRVDLRLRPHGSLGALALSVGDTVRYCQTEARAWERQVLIRSRGCAGDIELFRQFFNKVEDLVFSRDETVEGALGNVRRSKEQIDLENVNRRGFNVKLGRGGIREIEFLAQALQLAYGGSDRWLRGPHTLISLSRLADRKHLGDRDLNELSRAYEFLRRTEHVLQMENGLQTHIVADDAEKRQLLARRMTYAAGGDFERDLKTHTKNVHRIFSRVFDQAGQHLEGASPREDKGPDAKGLHLSRDSETIRHVQASAASPQFTAMLAANPEMAIAKNDTSPNDYFSEMMAEVKAADALHARLAVLRQTWQRFLIEIFLLDQSEKITIAEAKHRQTVLAEASIDVALNIVKDELALKYAIEISELNLAVLALGKLGGRGLDYGSDLDLILVYPSESDALKFAFQSDKRGKNPVAAASGSDRNFSTSEFYSRAVELFVTTLSSMTRDGNLYRVDLRLRPYGSKGLSAMPADAFLEYISETAAIWEMLAFVKLRAAGGDRKLGEDVEKETRRIIHERSAAADVNELRKETRRVRFALEQQHAHARPGKEIDIKYGPGGMLDVYFAMRFLQLRDNVPDDENDRSTPFMLERLHTKGSLNSETHAELIAGYEFLSALDHNLRLTVGRTTCVPIANQTAMTTIAERLNLTSPADLVEQLTLHRLAIRSAFENILAD